MTQSDKLCFVYQCYKQPMAFIKCLDNVRAHYPNAEIFVLNDNGNDYREICDYFKCDYTYFGENNDVHFDVKKLPKETIIEKYRKYLYRMLYVLSKSKSEYFVRLEDDVKIRSKIYHIPDFDIVGCYNVYGNFDEQTNYAINMTRGNSQENIVKYIFNCGGGSLIKRERFIEYINSIINNFKLLEIMYVLNPNNFVTVDITDGLGMLLMGYTVGRSICMYDNTANKGEYKSLQYALVNQYKKYYNMEAEIISFKSYLKKNKKEVMSS